MGASKISTLLGISYLSNAKNCKNHLKVLRETLDAIFARHTGDPLPIQSKIRSNLRLTRSMGSKKIKWRNKTKKIRKKLYIIILTKKNATKRNNPQLVVLYYMGYQRSPPGHLYKFTFWSCLYDWIQN